MTVKKLTIIEDGRLVPTDLSMDADLIEISKVEGNKLEIKEDGLYYKERIVIDGLESDGETIGIKDYGIDPKKISRISSTASSTEVTPDTLQSLEEHLANLYGYVQRLKGEVTENSGSTLYSLQALSDGYESLQERLVREYYNKDSVNDSLSLKADKIDLEAYSTIIETNNTIDSKITTYDQNVAINKFRLKSEPISTTAVYDASGILSTSPKIFIGNTTANSGGDWSIDFSHVGFTEIPMVVAMGKNVGTASADRRFASLNQNQPTKTGCSGKLLSSASSSAGLLATMTMVHGAGPVNIVAIGF